MAGVFCKPSPPAGARSMGGERPSCAGYVIAACARGGAGRGGAESLDLGRACAERGKGVQCGV